MDILSQYKQDHPEAFRPGPQWEPPKEYGFFIRLAMRLSGGRIRDINQASYALTIAVAVVLLISLLLYFGIPGTGTKTVPLLRSAHPDIAPR